MASFDAYEELLCTDVSCEFDATSWCLLLTIPPVKIASSGEPDQKLCFVGFCLLLLSAYTLAVDSKVGLFYPVKFMSSPLFSLCSHMGFSFFWRLSVGNTSLSADNAERINDEGQDDGRRLTSVYDNRLTPAERRFLQQAEKIELERLAKMASKSHRDRVQEFNQYLANLSEHYDIPKVGPG